MCSKDNKENLISINSICSSINFLGNGIVGFLNNLLISDLKNLQPNKYQYSALCNQKGRIIASLWINIENQQQASIICANNMVDTLINFFNMRKFRLKINIDKAKKNIVIDSTHNILISDNVLKTKTASVEEFYQFMFKLSLPWVDTTNTEKFIPQHVSLDLHENIMSFTKGCYPGQEIIARIKYLGKIKKRMAIVSNKDKSYLKRIAKNNTNISPIIYIKATNEFSMQYVKNQ